MTSDLRPLGALLPDFVPPPHPRGATMAGRLCRLRPLRVNDDAGPLFAQFSESPWVFDYLGEDPPLSPDGLAHILATWAARSDCEIFAICHAKDSAPLGYACLMSVNTSVGDIEIGNVNLSPALQRTAAATEAFSLMLEWAFAAGYRRVVWKCNALNMPSRRAAQRLGFSYEGLFRKHLIVKGRNRDTAWFAMTDDDWQNIGPVHSEWLSPANFTRTGEQFQPLGLMTASFLFARDPEL